MSYPSTRTATLAQVTDFIPTVIPVWSLIPTYAVGDVVDALGTNYFCKSPNTNQSPPNATYWEVITADEIALLGLFKGISNASQSPIVEGEACYIPAVAITSSRDFVRSSPITIRGSGIYGGVNGGAVINYTGAGTFLKLDTSGAGTLLEDFRVVGTSAMQNLIHIDNIYNQVNLNRFFGECDTPGNGVICRVSSAWDINLTNGTYRYGDIGIYADNQGVTGNVNNLNVINNNLSDNNIGYRRDTGAGGVVEGCDLSGCAIGIELGAGIGATEFLSAVTVGNNEGECETYARVGWNANAAAHIVGIVLDGGYLQCSDDAIKIDVARNTTIRGFDFSNVAAGKKHIVLTAHAVNTYIDVPELDQTKVTDNGINTTYAYHLMASAIIALANNYTLANNTVTKLPLDTVTNVRNASWDSTNKRLTPLRPGWYDIAAHASIGQMSAGKNIFVGVYKNGTRCSGDDVYGAASGTTPSTYGPNKVWMNGSTDYFEVYVFQNEGTSRTVTGNSSFTFLQVSPG